MAFGFDDFLSNGLALAGVLPTNQGFQELDLLFTFAHAVLVSD